MYIAHTLACRHADATTMKCRSCRGDHSFTHCAESRRCCVLCEQDARLKQNAKSHTYVTCKVFHGNEYTLMDRNGVVVSNPVRQVAAPAHKRAAENIQVNVPALPLNVPAGGANSHVAPAASYAAVATNGSMSSDMKMIINIFSQRSRRWPRSSRRQLLRCWL